MRYKSKVLALCAMLSITLSCAGWQKAINDTADYVFHGAKEFRVTFDPFVSRYCNDVFKKCVSDKDGECSAFRPCEVYAKSMMAIQAIVLDAKRAAAIGDETTAEAAARKAIALLEEVRQQLVIMGIL